MKVIRFALRLAPLFLLTLARPAAEAACAPAPAGLIAWWPGENSPDNLLGLPAAPVGITYNVGEVGQAFEFDGNAHYLATQLDVQPSALPETTWEAWVYPTRVNYSSRQQILSHDTGSYGRSLLIEGGTAKFGIFTGMNVWQPVAVTPNEWQHVAVVFAATNIYFYKNGVQYSFGSPPTPRNSSAKLQIGRSPGYGEYFQGRIDEVAVYNRALTPAEVQAAYSAGPEGLCRNSTTADLAISLQTTPPIAQIGDDVLNSILVVNLGPQAASFARVTFPFPPGAQMTSASVSQGTWSQVDGQFVWLLGDLPSGDSASMLLLTKSSSPGLQTNSASAASFSLDPNPANDRATQVINIARRYTEQDGEWEAQYVTLTNTPEAALTVRVGDIDNLGFGWPNGFDPFSGNIPGSHGFPWVAPSNAPAGTDRIMVVSSFKGTPPRGTDGYTQSTSRPANAVEPVTLHYDLGGKPVASAALQMFVDDFQASSWGAAYTVTLNGTRAPFLETIINALSQTGPVGKLISTAFPPEFLPLVQSGNLTILIDDFTTGAGDGFAIDFAKLLVNLKSFGQVGAVEGTIVDSATQQPIPGVSVWAGGLTTTTDNAGYYFLTNVPAGLMLVQTTHPDYAQQIQSRDLSAGQTVVLNFSLVFQPNLSIQHQGDQLLLSWPGSLIGFNLQSTEFLQPANWQPDGSVPTLVNGRFTVTKPISTATRFYRLAKP